MLWSAVSLLLSLYIANSGLRRRSLSSGGAAAAAAVGAIHMLCGLPYGATLIAFYVSSSRLTRWRGELKARLEADHLEGGQRTAEQVLVNSGVGALCALGAAWLRSSSSGDSCSRSMASSLEAAFLGFYACCTGDTWSSEVGIVGRQPPRLITSLQSVPPGTNGGVSLLGTGAAAAGGLCIGACFWAARLLARRAYSRGDWVLLPMALAAALLGSALDSLMGATLQYSGLDDATGQVVNTPPAADSRRKVRRISGINLLSNSAVNFLSSLAISMACGLTARHLALQL